MTIFDGQTDLEVVSDMVELELYRLGVSEEEAEIIVAENLDEIETYMFEIPTSIIAKNILEKK